MVYREATFEEYQKATEFAKIKYKFGLYIQIVATLLFLLLFIYTVINIEEMKANPKDYAEKKLGVNCNYPIQLQMMYDIELNGSIGNITSIRKW